MRENLHKTNTEQMGMDKPAGIKHTPKENYRRTRKLLLMALGYPNPIRNQENLQIHQNNHLKGLAKGPKFLLEKYHITGDKKGLIINCFRRKNIYI